MKFFESAVLQMQKVIMARRFAFVCLITLIVVSITGIVYLNREGVSLHNARLVLSANDGIVAVAFSPDSKVVAAGEQDGTIHVWEVVSGKELFTISPKGQDAADAGYLRCIAFNPESQVLAWGGEGPLISLFNIKTGKFITRLGKHESPVDTMAFHPKAEILATGTSHGILRFWQTKKGEADVIFDANASSGVGPRLRPIRPIAFDLVGDKLAFVESETLFLFDLSDGATIKARDHVSERVIKTLAFSPNGKLLAGGGQEITIWDSATCKKLSTIPISTRSLAFSPDGKRLAIGVNQSNHLPSYVNIWDMDLSRTICNFVCHLEHPFTQVVWSGDGATIATASFDKTVRLWDVQSILRKR